MRPLALAPLVLAIQLAPASAAVPTAPCGGDGGAAVSPARDSVLGPLAILGARLTPRHARDAFDGLGYKLPVTLAAGTTATLSVAKGSRPHARLVYRPRAQQRVYAVGVRGGDVAVRLRPCDPTTSAGRSGWPGGIVVDRRRCVTLRVQTADGRTFRRRVPVGRRC